jgi:hypothetical protein
MVVLTFTMKLPALQTAAGAAFLPPGLREKLAPGLRNAR